MDWCRQLSGNSAPRILALGAHADDIEIGCGGAIMRLIAENPDATVTWVVFSATPARACEARAGAASILAHARKPCVVVEDFRDGFFPYEGADIKERFELLKCEASPDIVFTHFRDDRHQDHRLVSELAWNTFRTAMVLEYEIPKYDGDFGMPNLYVNLARETVDAKVESLLTCFPSQAVRDWFDAETFRAVMRLRGMEARAPSGYAEAFYCRKLVV